jgi:hypothetical protein
MLAHEFRLPTGERRPLEDVRFFLGRPPLALVDRTFYLVRNMPPPALLQRWREQSGLPVRKLSHRLLAHLRKTR